MTTKTVSGAFEVKMTAEPPFSDVDGVKLGRARFDKRFTGPLEATSEVFMTSVTTPDPKARAYVAVERVTGSLEGRAGSFALVHLATMGPAGPALRIEVVPGSSTGALAGLSGTMQIRIEPGGAHFYDFSYALA